MPILAVGDSYTYGEEVGENDSWPAQLQRIKNQRVLNAGVSGYGFDQSVLRAELTLPTGNDAQLRRASRSPLASHETEAYLRAEPMVRIRFPPAASRVRT